MSSFKILTPANPKIMKGMKKGCMTFVLHLAPADLSGYQVCPMATEGCRRGCLNTAGRGGMMAGISRLTLADIKAGTLNTIQAARIRKTRHFFEERDNFMAALYLEVARAIKYAEKRGYLPAFRLNGTSDIRWERIPVTAVNAEKYPNLMAAFPSVNFYDYTKIANRRDLPVNYSLTFSLAENNEPSAHAAMDGGMNVAVVFRKELPASFFGRPVVNGDDTDLRFLDPKGVVVGLTAKGNAKGDTTGFVREVNSAAIAA